jgi:hypothetical protein
MKRIMIMMAMLVGVESMAQTSIAPDRADVRSILNIPRYSSLSNATAAGSRAGNYVYVYSGADTGTYVRHFDNSRWLKVSGFGVDTGRANNKIATGFHINKVKDSVAMLAKARWSLTGSSGTLAGTNFIGTTDDVDFVVRRNGNYGLIFKNNSIVTGINSINNGTTWVGRLTPTANSWGPVTYGNGLFVALGGGANQAMTSPDGITWTGQATVPAGCAAITYGNGLFAAVGTNTAMTSPDGINWTVRSVPTGYWGSVTYGNGLFVAVAQGGAADLVMTSSDGITWTGRAASHENLWYSVTYGNGLFVAVAGDYTPGISRVMSSPDGITWTARNASNDNSWYSVTYGNGLFVAVSDMGPNTANRVMTSPDGINWSNRTITGASSNFYFSVTYGNGLFVAVGAEVPINKAITSPDGINWTRITIPDNLWYGVTYGNGTFVSVAGADSDGYPLASGANGVITSTSSSLEHTRLGIGIDIPTANLDIKASTTTGALMRLRVGPAPTTPNDGDVWLESNTNTGLKIRINGVTKTVSLL